MLAALVVFELTPLIPTILCRDATIAPFYRKGNQGTERFGHTGDNGRLLPTPELQMLLSLFMQIVSWL